MSLMHVAQNAYHNHTYLFVCLFFYCSFLKHVDCQRREGASLDTYVKVMCTNSCEEEGRGRRGGGGGRGEGRRGDKGYCHVSLGGGGREGGGGGEGMKVTAMLVWGGGGGGEERG